MEATTERSVSGRRLVLVSLAVIAAVLAAGIVLGPSLRQQVLQEERPRTLREPIATGQHDGQVWEAVGRFDGTANCVELRFRGDVLDRACDAGAPQTQVTTLPDDGPTVVYGIAPETADEHAVALDNGEEMAVPVRAGELGFPVGFWAALVPEGRTVADDPG